MVQGRDGEDIYRHFESVTPSRHFTVVFNLFVLCQIFNMVCARKINDEWNIFSGLLTNVMFIGVMIVITVGQIIIVQYGGWSLKVHREGLTQNQWLLCVIPAVFGLFVNWFMKCVPDRFFPVLGDEDPAEIFAARADYDTLRDRKRRSDVNIA